MKAQSVRDTLVTMRWNAGINQVWRSRRAWKSRRDATTEDTGRSGPLGTPTATEQPRRARLPRSHRRSSNHPEGSGQSASTSSCSSGLQQRGRLPASAGAVTVTNEPIAAYRQRVVNAAHRWKISPVDAAELCDNVDDAQQGPGTTDAGSAAPRRVQVVAKPRPRRVAVRLLAVPLVNEADTYGAHRVYELDICDPVTWESYQSFSIRYSKLRAAMLGSDKLWAGAVPAGRFPGKGLFADYTFDDANACSRGESIRLYLEAVLNADNDGTILGASQLHTALGVDRYGQRALLEVAVARSRVGIFCPEPGTGGGGGVLLSPGPATAAGTTAMKSQPPPQPATVVPQPQLEHGLITPPKSPPAAP